ncbi:MAG TPA: ECF transporter S component [Firmicutes bacterium]|nr:ECF transporter S component [Bacillota bacterium]
MTVVLAVSPIGRIPVPWTGINATTMHLPAIIGGILDGPAVGAAVGLIFGLFSFATSGGFFADPLVSILPRLFIGPVAAWAFRATQRPEWAAAAGTAANTLGVLGMMGVRGYLPWKALGVIALTHGLPEIVLAVAVVTLFHRKVQAAYLKDR